LTTAVGIDYGSYLGGGGGSGDWRKVRRPCGVAIEESV
jgi:hypothetical protein